jgi:hypothetical protein
VNAGNALARPITSLLEFRQPGRELAARKSKEIQIKTLGFIWISLPESILFKGLYPKQVKKSAAFRLASQVAKQFVSSADPALSPGVARPKVVVPEISV